MDDFLHDLRVSIFPREGSGETVLGGPILECAIDNTLFYLGAVKCGDVSDSVNL